MKPDEDIGQIEIFKNAMVLAFIRYIVVALSLVVGVPLAVAVSAYQELRLALWLALFVVLYNTAGWYYAQRNGFRNAPAVALAMVIADSFVLTALVHITSGIVSFFTFFYLFPVLTAGVIFLKQRRPVFYVVGIISLLYSALLFAEYQGIIPLPKVFPWLPAAYANPYRIAVFAIMVPVSLWLLTFFITLAGREILKRRDEIEAGMRREIADLRGMLEKEAQIKLMESEKRYRDQFEAELKLKIAELEKLNRFMMDREGQMIELKEEVNQLLKESGREAKYML